MQHINDSYLINTAYFNCLIWVSWAGVFSDSSNSASPLISLLTKYGASPSLSRADCPWMWKYILQFEQQTARELWVQATCIFAYIPHIVIILWTSSPSVLVLLSAITCAHFKYSLNLVWSEYITLYCLFCFLVHLVCINKDTLKNTCLYNSPQFSSTTN